MTFGLFTSLSLPELAAVGQTSRQFVTSALRDDVLWWRILLQMPPGPRLSAAVSEVQALKDKGNLPPQGMCRRLVKEQVEYARAEESERRRRLEEERNMMRDMRNPLMVQPPRRPYPGFPGMGGPGGFNDIAPGGGFLPGPFGGGGSGGRRDPFGGGGGFGGPSW